MDGMAHGRAAEGVTKGGPDPEQPAEEKAQPSPAQTSLMRGVRSKGKTTTRDQKIGLRCRQRRAGRSALAAADLVEEVEGSERDLAPALIVRKSTESMDVLYCCCWRSFFFSWLSGFTKPGHSPLFPGPELAVDALHGMVLRRSVSLSQWLGTPKFCLPLSSCSTTTPTYKI